MSDEDTGQEDTGQKEDTGHKDSDQQDSDQQDGNKQDGDKQDGDQQDVERYESGQIAEKPEPSDEQKQNAEEMRKSYIEDRPTTVLPGSDNTVTGTAVNDWIDDDGNPVHGDIEDDRQEAAERDREINKRAAEGKEKAKAEEKEKAEAEEKAKSKA